QATTINKTTLRKNKVNNKQDPTYLDSPPKKRRTLLPRPQNNKKSGQSSSPPTNPTMTSSYTHNNNKPAQTGSNNTATGIIGTENSHIIISHNDNTHITISSNSKAKQIPQATTTPNNPEPTDPQNNNHNNKEQTNPDDQNMDTESIATIASNPDEQKPLTYSQIAQKNIPTQNTTHDSMEIDHTQEWVNSICNNLQEKITQPFNKELWNYDEIIAALKTKKGIYDFIEHKLLTKPTNFSLHPAIEAKFKHRDSAF